VDSLGSGRKGIRDKIPKPVCGELGCKSSKRRFEAADDDGSPGLSRLKRVLFSL